MNKALVIAGIVCAAFLLMGASGSRQAADEPRQVTVSGEAQLNVVPDEIAVSIGTQACGGTASEARQANAEIAKKVIALADELGIDRRQVQTDALEIDLVKPEFRDWRACYPQEEKRSYGARQMIRFTLKDPKNLEPLLTRALEAGAIKVLGVDYRTTKLRKYRDEARIQAIKAAREKAELLAGQLGQKIGEPQTIREEPYYGRDWYYYGSWWSRGYGNNTANYSQNVSDARGSAPEGEIALGQIAVTARVQVSFELR